MMTRTSSVMAINICCRSPALTSSLPPAAGAAKFLILDTFVSPSTITRTLALKRSSICSKVTASVSSTVSCSSPATIESTSILSSARMHATATGCMMYGSPDLRNCVLCAWKASTSPRAVASTS